MAGRIPREFIDDLMGRVDIVDVIDARVPLKKAGANYAARCPFHEERTPSFTVSPDKQFYHCFGCGAHGTAIGFLMEYERLDFVDAVEQLARQVGVEVPREGHSAAPPPSHQPLYALLEESARYFRHQLRHHKAAANAVAYLKGRGLSGEIAADYGIGYAPPGWDGLMRALGRDEKAIERLVEAGMLIEREGRRYDRFRDRIMFPIRDRRGRVIAFGGRVLGDALPKYLNSPETPVFHKGRELYGLYEARQANRHLKRLLVVEGYMDVVALAQFGLRYAVATLGTAVTGDHLERLFRVTNEVVFCFDGDRAGREAAWRGLENALPQIREGRQVRFMFLPEGEDPDTLVRQIGPEGFEAAVEKAVPLSQFFFEQLAERTDVTTLDGRARLVELARPYLSKVPPGVFRQLMIERLAELAGTGRESIERLVGETAAAASAPPPPPAKRVRAAGKPRGAPSVLRHAVTLLLLNPSLAAQAPEEDALAGLELPGVALLREMLDLMRRQPHLNTAALLEHWRDREEGRHLFTLARRDPLLAVEQDDLEEEFRGALRQLQRLRAQQRRKALEGRFKELTPEEKAEYSQLIASESGSAT